MAHNNPEDCWRIGFYSSIAGHVAIVVVSVFGLFGGLGELPEPVIYSVTVEPGKNLGGKSQLAKDDKPSTISPVKNVKADSSPQEEVKDKPVEEKPVKEKPVDDAEVSISEKKPTPKATPKQEKHLTENKFAPTSINQIKLEEVSSFRKLSFRCTVVFQKVLV